MSVPEGIMKIVQKYIHKLEDRTNIDKWTDKHPDYMNSDILQEEYTNLIRGCTSSIDACKDKVVKKLCDNVYLSKGVPP